MKSQLMFHTAVPDSFAHTIIELYGEAGVEWRGRLPSILAHYAQCWSLIVGCGIAQAVLSALWSFEDHGHGWEWPIACAQLLAELA